MVILKYSRILAQQSPEVAESLVQVRKKIKNTVLCNIYNVFLERICIMFKLKVYCVMIYTMCNAIASYKNDSKNTKLFLKFNNTNL